MVTQMLQDNFRMRRLEEGEWLPAIVPGTVYTDLLLNGEMENPFWKDNEEQALKRMEFDYEYSTMFRVDSVVYEKERVLLRFDGLDTIADIYVNGELAGQAYNMHRIWEFDVKKLLNPGQDNELHVVLHSPLQYIREAFEKSPTRGSEDAMDGFVHIRKAHCMFGWDWGAHLPDAGIFRPVRLIGIDHARIDSVYITQIHENGKVRLQIRVEEDKCDSVSTTYEVKVTDPDGNCWDYENSPDEITIEEPRLWWPNGYGAQDLYELEVIQKTGGTETDSWKRRIGLRTMTMHIEKDQWGSCFAHQVNGISIFAMGADYIPEDHLLGRVNSKTTRNLLEQCKSANFNAIRVWGGGYYPEDWFYDICDELGLVVWQDFMFACAVYDLTPEFEANIRQEFTDNIKRLRHHASLGLWCGNNEMELFVKEGNWVSRHSEVRDYFLMYERIIPELLKEYDPNTFYWPASPSSGGSFDEPNDPNRGDVHFWEVWHGNKPFSEYRRHYFRYASEFGFQSFPSVKTIETITDDPRDMNIFSYVMEKHQRNFGANGKIMNYLQQTYRYPYSFETVIYASQLLQADAIRYGVEHFRRNRGRCMGAIYWQLNDCWPVASWASIDYCQRWKALHYYAKRFFSPCMISCEEEGLLTQDADMNRQHYHIEKSIHLNVANETREDENVTVKWQLRDAGAMVLREESREIMVPALTSVWLDKEELPDVDMFTEYVSYQLMKNGELISEGTVIFSLPKYFKYQDPQLTCRVENGEIIIQSKTYAKNVEILNQKEDLILSDNYFDMNAGEKRIKIISGKPDKLRLRSVYDIG